VARNAWRRAGRVVATDAPPADIATAVRELLADPAAVREARRFAGVIAGLGGGDAAAQKVIRLAGARAQDRALFTA
jgi:UDP:flavonoid glycosyltransferase YjiC (YdhE family)